MGKAAYSKTLAKTLAEKAPAAKLTKGSAASKSAGKKSVAQKPVFKKPWAKRARAGEVQYAALPWRRGEDGAVEVLLITSRDTRRWVIPKGWPIKGAKKPLSAAREAFEEAGVEGEAGKILLGAYIYSKRLGEHARDLRVEVYALRVEREREAWPEMGQRDKLWTTPAIAAGLVEEPELSAILKAFAPN